MFIFAWWEQGAINILLRLLSSRFICVNRGEVDFPGGATPLRFVRSFTGNMKCLFRQSLVVQTTSFRLRKGHGLLFLVISWDESVLMITHCDNPE